MDNTFNIDSPYLEHHGILGMKWGIRRYQNPDGTLTAAGRRRVKRAMKQHDVVMTTRDDRERDKEYKRFRDIVTQMYPAEVADLMIKVEQANAIKQLSDLQTEDRIKKGLEYTASIVDILSKTGTAVGNFASAANTIASIRNTNQDINKKALENEKALAEWKKTKNPIQTIENAANAGKQAIDGIKNLNDAKNKVTGSKETPKTETPKTETPKTETPKNSTSTSYEAPKTSHYDRYVVSTLTSEAPPKMSDYVSITDSQQAINILSQTGYDFTNTHNAQIEEYLKQSYKSTDNTWGFR